MITFKDNPFWWSSTSDNITSGCAKVVVTRRDKEQKMPKAMSEYVSLTLPVMTAPVTQVNATVATIHPENVAFFDVDVYPPGGTGVILKMIIDGNSKEMDGTATFIFCRGKRPDVRARLAVNNYCDCDTIWTATLGSVAKFLISDWLNLLFLPL